MCDVGEEELLGANGARHGLAGSDHLPPPIKDETPQMVCAAMAALADTHDGPCAGAQLDEEARAATGHGDEINMQASESESEYSSEDEYRPSEDESESDSDGDVAVTPKRKVTRRKKTATGCPACAGQHRAHTCGRARHLAACLQRMPIAQADIDNVQNAELAAADEGLELVRADNSSGYKGVVFRRELRSKPYEARKKSGQRHVSFGFFATAQEAALVYARNEAALAERAKQSVQPVQLEPPLAIVEAERDGRGADATSVDANGGDASSQHQPQPYSTNRPHSGSPVASSAHQSANTLSLSSGRVTPSPELSNSIDVASCGLPDGWHVEYRSRKNGQGYKVYRSVDGQMALSRKRVFIKAGVEKPHALPNGWRVEFRQLSTTGRRIPTFHGPNGEKERSAKRARAVAAANGTQTATPLANPAYLLACAGTYRLMPPKTVTLAAPSDAAVTAATACSKEASPTSLTARTNGVTTVAQVETAVHVVAQPSDPKPPALTTCESIVPAPLTRIERMKRLEQCLYGAPREGVLLKRMQDIATFMDLDVEIGPLVSTLTTLDALEAEAQTFDPVRARQFGLKPQSCIEGAPILKRKRSEDLNLDVDK